MLSSERYSSQNWSLAISTSLSIESLDDCEPLLRPTLIVRSNKSRARINAFLASAVFPFCFHFKVRPTSLPIFAICEMKSIAAHLSLSGLLEVVFLSFDKIVDY